MYSACVPPSATDPREVLRRRAANAGQRRVGRGFESYEAFVLAYGHEYKSAPLDESERTYLEMVLGAHRKFWRRGFEYKFCFTNAQQLMAFDDTKALIYVEGFVVPHTGRLPPFHHGWLSLHGKVIDVTAPTREVGRKLPAEPPQIHGQFEGRSYFGVPFLRRYVRQRANANKGWGSLLDDERNDFRLLARGGGGAVRAMRTAGH